MNKILLGDCLQNLKTLPDQSAHCCVTSPPYWGLRDYGKDDQIGLEQTPEEFVIKLVDVFREVRRVLRDDGTLWLNLGDSYARQSGGDSDKESDRYLRTGRTGKSSLLFREGSHTPPAGIKPKDLVGIPWMVAFALRANGWYLRSDIIWHKPNPMPESVTDRPTKSHEYIFLLSKSQTYYYDYEAIKENTVAGCSVGRNKRTVWTVTTKPYSGAHFATYPVDLITPCILAGCPVGGVVLDPFMGAGTTAIAAVLNQRQYIGCELSQDYKAIAEQRIQDECGLFLLGDLG